MRKICAAAAAVVVVATSGAGSVAYAETGPPESTEADPGEYCVYNIKTGDGECSPDEAVAGEAERRAGGGRLVKVWAKPNYKGKWMVLHAGSSAEELCEGGELVGQIKDLRTFHKHLPRGQNWNNRISSLKPKNGCAVALFGRKNLQGQHTDWIAKDTPRLGDLPTGWNNAATSMLFG